MSELSTVLVHDSSSQRSFDRINKDIEAFVNGGPDLEDEHFGLNDVDVEGVHSLWVDARKRKTEKEKAEAERKAKADVVKVASADSATAEGWGKRRSWGGDEERVQDETRPSASKANATTPKADEDEVPKPQPEAARSQPEDEPELARAAADGVSPEPRTTLPAVIDQRALATWADAGEAINEDHAIIDNVGSKSVIACWELSPLDPARQVVVFQNKESFLLRYSNRYATIEVADGKGGS